MSHVRTIKRVLRRETHSSRALVSIVVATLLALAFLWAAAETVLWILKDRPLLADPPRVGDWLVQLPATTIPGALGASGVGVSLLGVLVLVAAAAPGRKARRSLDSDRSAIVVDDQLIAAALSRRCRLEAGLAPGQVTTTVGARSVRVVVRPTSGVPLEAEVLKAAVDGELAALGLKRRVSSSVRIVDEGVVGQ
ncbi:hypothetical protein ACIQTZ_11520 [Paenarthrobacter sp. NPDC090520]|uniref:hypothetical protein n=1 Tax=Paenarthrobacter sp. NPDC090520 TaxID=3364382 RepID=UPI00382612A7